MFFKENLKLLIFAYLKIPMMGFIRPRIVELNDAQCHLKIKLNRRSKNHLNCMYIAAFTIGAESAAGILAWREIEKSGKRIHLLFKDFKADFHKRAEDHVIFKNDQGKELKALVEKAILSGEREQLIVNVKAYTAAESEPVATFHLTLSISHKPKNI